MITAPEARFCSRLVQEQSKPSCTEERSTNQWPSVLCRVCGRADKTIEHIALECGRIGLSGATPLRTALGFAGKVGVTNPRAAKVTMQCLERWRAVVVSQRSRTQGGAVQ
ncbi:hypothetical protein MTO96_048947 [Rhipicephalus appendiculatus]